MNVIKNRISLYIVIAVAVILLIGGIIAATYSGNPDSPTRLLSLGEKYLSELNYEQALVQFLKVIEIEPMNPRGYSGAAEAYAGLEEYRNAVDILNKGIEITGDASLAEFLQKMNIGIVSGKVCDALSYFTGQTDFNLENAKVSAVNTSIKAYTNTEGEYNFYLPAGQYKLLAEYSGYMPMVLEFKVSGNDTTHMPIIKLVKNSVESGVAQGQILDSFTGEAIVNANIVIKKINLDSIENVRSTITDGNGGYSISLPAGYYAAEASAAGYIPATFEIITIEKQTIPAQNGVLTPVLEEGQMCIVLTWGETPADLDSHLTGPSTQGLPFHICYYNLASRNENEVLVDLDLDDTDSFGPETTTIYTALSGKYSFYVHDFTNRDNPTSAALANSGAKVSVYLRNSLAKEYHVPSGLIGVTWNVFEFEDGTFSFSSSTAADIADIEGDDYYQGKIKIQGDTLSQVKEFTDMDLHNLGFEKGETLLDLVDRFGLPTGYTSREELIADMQTGMLRREHSSPSSSANWHEQGVYYAYFSPVDWTLRSIDLDANAYLNKLPHQITSDTNLETIVERFGLDARISDICKRTSLEDIWEYCQTHRLSAILYEGDPEFKRVEIALRNGTLVYSEYSYMDSSNQEMEFDHQWEFSFDTEQATLTLSLDEYQINNISLHFDREWD